MPSRKYQGKNREGSDFIHVDLLPEMKRPRQFNVNIIFIVLIAVSLSWLLIYLPLNDRQSDLDSAYESQNDLQSRVELTDDIIATYRLDPERIDFMNDIESIRALQGGYGDYEDGVSAAVLSADSSGRLLDFNYNAVTGEIEATVSLTRSLYFSDLEIELLEAEFVDYVDIPASEPDGARHVSQVVIGVDDDAE